jgi:hypothetical protein
MPTWDTDTGDLQCRGLSIEVKAFSSTGPTTFGPTEKWDRIYFLDATQFNDSVFKVYECKLKNTSHIWQQLRVNKGETYGEHAKQGRRPRLCFSDICQQLGTNCKLIFEGTFSEKLCDVNEPYRHTAYGKGSILSLSFTSTTATPKIATMTNSQQDMQTTIDVHKNYTRKELLRMGYRDMQKLASGFRKRVGKKAVSQKKNDLLTFLYKCMNISS